MNGSSGIVPTVDLATNNNSGFACPVYPMMGGFGGGFGNGMFGGDAIWLIVLLALIWNGNNGNGGFFGNNGFDNGYAWLSNGQKEIMNNTNNGFDTLHLSNQLEGTRDALAGISNQMCTSTSDVIAAINNGFHGVEIGANNRQMADMQQMFNLSTQLSAASADNRLGIANLNATILSENCADRAALADSTQRIVASQVAGMQRILDQLSADKLDEKNSKIAELERQVLMKDLAASQVQQTSNIVDMTYARLRDCPIESTPIYGRIPIFTCNGNNGCGCGNNYYSTNLI